jgi:hypothetical protein
MGERPQGCTLDRIDNALGYGPGNCRWATAKEQAMNTRIVVRIPYGGKVRSCNELSQILGVSRKKIMRMLARGHDFDANARKYEGG